MELEKNLVVLNITTRISDDKEYISATFLADCEKGLDKGTILNMYCGEDYIGPKDFNEFAPLDRVRVVFDWKEFTTKESGTKNAIRLIDIKRL